MILNDFIEPKIKFSNDKLDAVLAELCGLILAGQRVNPKLNGKVAAAVLDPMGKLVTGVNYLHGDKRVHAENAAIENYEQEYGQLPKGCIIITTLSPCNEANDRTAAERYGESCTDLLNSCNIKMAYCGYEDYTQDDIKNNFTVVVTSNEKIKELCKRIADTFLKNLEETTITTNEAIDPAILDLAAARMGYRNHLAVPQRQLPTLYKLAATTELSTPTSNELRRHQKALDQRKRNLAAVNFSANHWDPDEEMTEDNGKTKAENFIHQVYSQYPEWPYGQADRVMVWGKGEEQEFAAFKLKPGTGDNTVSIDWIMAGPEQRKGVGTRAIQELQRLAQEDGVKLTLYPWDKGQISQASLKRFYKRQGFQPVAKGAAPMQWEPNINELKIDNSNGIGAVPYNKDVDYFGLRVKMRPSKFLELAKPMPMSANDKETIQHLEKEKDLTGFAAPFLTLNMEGEFPRVDGHDGRHRMTAIRNTEGDIPVEVHIFPRYMRNRDLTPELIDKMNSLIISETGRYVVGPIFSQAVKEAINEFAPTPSNDDDGDVPPEIYTLANRWWNNTDDQDRIANVLRSMGWDIQESDGEEDVCQLTYRDGSVYYLNGKEFDGDLYENFADGKHPGRKGLSKRMGVNTKASVSSLRKTAKHSSGEKARMAHWLANMKSGREKAKKK